MLFYYRLGKWCCQRVDERGFSVNVVDVVDVIDVCSVVDVDVVDAIFVDIVDVGYCCSCML
jgi:hypothetical protein